jgi:hypothetical protein
MEPIQTKPPKIRGMRRLFFKKGTCSQTYFYLLNRELGYHYEDEERAIDPLAGGIYQQGYQCGMLWGSAMAIGAESYRRLGDPGKAMAVTIEATQRVMESFRSRTDTIECYEITRCDWGKKGSIAKYMLTGRAVNCFNLAARWAPEAVQAAQEGISDGDDGQKKPLKCCACEVIRKMGGSEKEMAMVAGFAGGLGLSGNGCGALAAAMWMKTLREVRDNIYKMTMTNPTAERLLNIFYEASDYEMMCSEITGKRFNNAEEHSEFIENGGCARVIDALAGN